MRFGSKVPGTAMEIRDVNMDFAYGGSFTESRPEAYERLILDVLLGDPPLFPQHEEVELSWKILDPIVEYWAEHGQARHLRVRHLGPGVRGRDAGPRRPRPGGGRDSPTPGGPMIELTDTDSSEIAAEFVRARRRAGSPAMGMVMTLVIVADEDDADEAMTAARSAVARAPRPHPRRGHRRRPRRRARSTPQVGIGSGASGERALIRLTGEVTKHAESVVLPLLLPDSPVVVWWPGRAPRRPGRRPARRARHPADHRRRRRCPRSKAQGDAHPVRAPTRPATPTWPGPGSPAGGRCWPRPSTSTRARCIVGVGDRRADQPQRRPAGRLARRPAQVRRSTAAELRGPRHHRGGADAPSSGDITVTRSDGRLATLSSPGQPDRPVALKRRDLAELLVRGAAPARPRRHLRRDREAAGQDRHGRQEPAPKTAPRRPLT